MMIWIKTEIGGACHIKEAIRLAIQLSRRTGAGVKFDFNEIHMYVSEDSDVDEGYRFYLKQLERQSCDDPNADDE